MYYFIRVWAICLALFLVACGGGGGSAGLTSDTGTGTGTGTGSTGTTGTPTVVLPIPAAVEILSSTTQLSSASNSTASFTVIVKDAQNQAIPNQTVTFAATSGNLSGVLPAPHTGASGEAITTVSLSPGADQSNRDIVVTATAGGVTRTITVAVQGSVLSLAGDSAVLAGGTTLFTAKAVDSAGQPLAGVTLTATSSLNNTVSTRTVVTNTQGVATFSYTGTNAGADTVTISGLGTSAKSTISVSADDFRFETPAVNTSVVVGSTVTATVRFVSGGVPVAGRVVTFSSTRGNVVTGSAVTDANGRASTDISSTTSGPASVIAQASSAQITLPLVFVATTPATIVLQANPGAVPPNSGAGTLSQAALQATVRDATGNPVSGKVVNFTAITDGSNGSISPGSGITDANGSVTVQFIPGPLTTPSNGVVISATVQGTSISSNAVLTVSGQALFISISHGNVITNLNVTTYQKEFRVYVTDANGAPAGNRVVNLSVYPDLYGKGALAWNGKSWSYDAASPTFCPNEDVNRNGILNAGEDTNHDGRLTPGLPIVISPGSVTTGADGLATFFLQYGENFVPWLTTTLTARASVGGTESVQSQFYVPQGATEDFTNENVPPAGFISPFGTAQDCTNPN